MIISDEKTDYLYLADSLKKKKYKPFLERLIPVLNGNGVDYGFLPGTKDIWAKDFMPVQVAEDRYLQFRYEPDYLMKHKKWRATISDATGICRVIGVTPVKSDIVLDGGNLVRFGRKAVMTRKIFRENPGFTETGLLSALMELLLVDRIIVIAAEARDWLGHADGMVRFLDEHTVLVNDYHRKTDRDFGLNLRMSLRNAGLETIPLPYNPYTNASEDDARGMYINFLRIKDFVLVPAFGLAEDEKAARDLSRLFSCTTVDTVRSDEIAKEGGVLNCISWNIRKKRPAGRDSGPSGKGPAPKGVYSVYIVKCANGALYTGITTNIARRVGEHNAARGARYTRLHAPVELVWTETHPDHSSAMKREAQIKRLSRTKKLALISGE